MRNVVKQWESGRKTIGRQWESGRKTIGRQWESGRKTIGRQWESGRKTIGRQWESTGRTCNCLTSTYQLLHYCFPALLRSLYYASQSFHYRLTLYNWRFYEKN